MKLKVGCAILIFSLGLVGLILLSLYPVKDKKTCGPRIRKDWDMLTDDEKSTYKNAIQASMDSGAYLRFIELHTEMRSEMEAHRQCMFIYWHRMMLLAFENMLRGQGPAYACVTVPYFNWIVASARMTSGACDSFETCLAIMTELGGTTSGTSRNLSINGIETSGRCVDTPPLNHFCELRSLQGTTQCAKCVTRGNWSTVQVPTATSYASVRAQIFNGINIGEMSPLVEEGCHNNVHGTLDGAMGTNSSPSDPIFYSHHSTVDLLHVIFHKCRVGTGRLTFTEKASHPVAWTSCARRGSGLFRPTDTITMRTGELGINSIPARDDPIIGQFFEGIPNQYAGIMDVRDLGTNSYGYQTTGQLATLYTQCDASPVSRKLEEKSVPVARSPPVMCSMDNDGYDENGEQDALVNNFPELDYTGEDDGHQDIIIVDRLGHSVDAESPRDAYFDDESEKKVVDWYDEALKDMGGDSHENMIDMERQACMFEDQCLGGIEDYSPEFKAIWNVKEPRCKRIVNAIKNGTQTIQFKAWREVMEARFGCPHPTNSTNSTLSSSQ